MTNNADLGITIQKVICDEYGLKLHPNAVKQFEANYNLEYVPGLKSLIRDVFKEIGKEPRECITYAPSEKKGEKRSPHNFVLSDGSLLSIRTNKSGDKVAPRTVGQCGIDTFNTFFSEIAGREINTKEEIKQIVVDNVDKMLPVFLDYMFASDYTIWIQNKDEFGYDYTIFDRNKIIDIIPDKNNFSFTRNLGEWKESTTLKYKNQSLAEIQIHTNRTFKFRFCMRALLNYVVEQKLTTETFGMTAEKTVCDLFGLKYPSSFSKRCSASLQRDISSTVKNAFERLPAAIKHTGSEKGERGGESKCSYDFVLEGDKTLSLKTNTGKMICPPEVGQPGAETCYMYFGHLIDADKITNDSFKQMVIEHIDQMLPIYIEHLLDSDYMLWIYKRKEKYDYKIFDSDFAKGMKWDPARFSFTKPTIGDWNESNTLKYDGISIGEFQVHKARSCYKFRFNMENFERVINNKRKIGD